MRRRSFLLFVPLLLSPAAIAAEQADVARAAGIVVAKTNDFRRRQGLQAVEVQAKLAQAAQAFAGFMARTNKYGHAADGRRPSERVLAIGYDYCIVTENISYQFRSTGFDTAELAANFVDGWIASPGHRENLADPDATETGVGVARSAETGRYYAVQLFGRPRTQSIEFRVRNQARETVTYRLGEREFTLAPGAARVHEECRPGALALGRTTLRPADGERFVVVQEIGRASIRRE